ncbi:MAG: acetyl-CoA C-acyltransferase, partial [Planctomycetaceae bacterium]|nr:acetyl-CoA C-acyltransferase [Planctomycetaceae bacterium]
MRTSTKITPLAVLDGIRTPFSKAWTELADQSAVQLGTAVVRECLKRSQLSVADVDEVIMGNVSCPADAANIARVIALQAGIPRDRIAHTVNRNCASGMESLVQAWQVLREGRAGCVVAGGTESMSNIPLLVRRDTSALLAKLGRAHSIWQKVRLLTSLRPRHFRPVPAVLLGLTDPTCGLNMGQTAERLATEFGISREEQDAFALESHRRAAAARERCFLSGETLKYPRGSGKGLTENDVVIEKDNGPRSNQS